jgi:hypothetical protein
MIRLPLTCSALVGALLWVPTARPANAEDPKPAQPAPKGQETQPPPSTGTPVPPPPNAQGLSPQTEKINELIRKGWADAGIKRPAEKASDHEFMRRVFIDLIGRIPTPEEIADFETDTKGQKRARLVNRLLYEESYKPRGKGGAAATSIQGLKKVPIDYTDEYAEHWANMWTVWLMTRTGHPLYRNQMRTWLEIQFSKNLSHKDMAVALLTATGKSNENGAVNFIIHHLGEAVPPSQSGEPNQGKFDAVPITSRVTKLFLGLQTHCTQCHDHPHNKEWVQADFWGVNAFFRQTLRSATPSAPPMNRNQMDNPVQISLFDDNSQNTDGIVLYERRDGKKVGSYAIMLKDLADALDGKKSTRVMPGGVARRKKLAEWVVAHDNFAKAYVNRIWGHLFGRGLNKDASVDDFGSNNEVVHPELLKYLGDEFAKYNYDPKKLLEWVCTSEAYQLSHVAVKEYADPKFDPYFARMSLKALSPEVLFESLWVAGRVETKVKDDEKKKLKNDFMSKLVRNFGDDEGNELSFNGTIVQALMMMNGKDLNDVIGGARGADLNKSAVADLVRKYGASPGRVYDELFLLTLNRHPTSAEIAKLETVRSGAARVNVGAAASTPPPKGKGPAPKGPKGPTVTAPGAAAGDLAFYQDVFWALLNTNEFMLNH